LSSGFHDLLLMPSPDGWGQQTMLTNSWKPPPV
jgi:hypothetical protein